ncbi:MAG TPA: NHL repeat-containing protein [Chloroflexota bacterium]|nr:NHL repeat-containing protein [Chloroflexota bacterium]
MRVARSRRLVGLLTLLAVLAIGVGVTGVELPALRLPGGGGSPPAPVAGVHAIAAGLLLRVGAGAPQGGELAFMAVEPGGNLVISDSKRHTVMRFDPTGHLLSEWGPRLGDTVLGEPAGVAVQGDNFYVVDRGTPPRILELDATGRLQTILNLESFGTYGLNGLAVDRGGNLYAADTGRNRILVLAPNGALVRQIGHSGTDLGGMTQPMMLAFAPDGTFVVADWENTRLERWDANFEATDVWPTPSHPFGVAIDQLGRIYAPDTDHRRVQAYSAQGALLGEMGAAGSPTIDVAPKQVAVARSDQPSLYVLGADGVVRLDLENTAPPPQGGGDVDPLSLVVIGLLVAILVLAIVARRSRRAPDLT